jgi:predicted acetyltransferase
MTGAYPIRPITEADWAAYNAVSAQAFNNSAPPDEELDRERLVFEFDRSLAAFDGPDLVGTANAYSFRMTVPGGALPVAGVSFVSVLPTHRRRGILSAIMAHQLSGLAEGGEAVAALWASEPGIYGRFGYGMASFTTRIRVRRREVTIASGVPSGAAGAGAPIGPVQLRETSLDPLPAELAKVYDQILPTRPGLQARDDRWWRSVLYDSAHWRGSSTPLRCLLAEDDDGPCGYAAYSVQPSWDSDSLPSSSLGIRELMATDARAAAALWTDLLSRDLVDEVTARLRPSDDPLLHLASDLRRLRPQLADGLWVRLVRVDDALSRRQYSGPVDVVFEVTDGLLPANSGRWHLLAGPHDGSARCERTTRPADLALPVAALGAAYLGGTPLAALARAGQVAELRPGRLAAVSAAFSWDPAPWCPMIF